MNRDIKFRAREKTEPSRWQYGYYIKHKLINPYPVMFVGEKEEDKIPKYEEYLIIEQDGDWNMESIQYKVAIKPETIGQYTGLKDKRNKEIYDGDIIDAKGNIFIVKYGEYATKLFEENYPTSIGKQFGLYVEGLETNNHCNLISPIGGYVIGNIYDNPELLGEINEKR